MEDIHQFYVLGISLLVNVVFGIFIIYSNRERKRIYKMLNEVNNSISEKNHAISEQAAKLAEAYENLWKINQRLEQEVVLRTERVRVQHNKLVERAHFNMHKLRGSLSSILGLLYLIQKEEKSQSLGDLLDLVHVCTRELDEIVRDFTQQLNNDF
jgi:sensor histidine kinase YesM